MSSKENNKAKVYVDSEGIKYAIYDPKMIREIALKHKKLLEAIGDL